MEDNLSASLKVTSPARDPLTPPTPQATAQEGFLPPACPAGHSFYPRGRFPFAHAVEQRGGEWHLPVCAHLWLQLPTDERATCTSHRGVPGSPPPAESEENRPSWGRVAGALSHPGWEGKLWPGDRKETQKPRGARGGPVSWRTQRGHVC